MTGPVIVMTSYNIDVGIDQPAAALIWFSVRDGARDCKQYFALLLRHISSNIVSHRRLRWQGHLARMCDKRLPTRMLFGHMDGSGVRGRSQKQWLDYVKNELQFIRLSFTWWRKSQDRAGWRAAIECVLQRT